MNTLLDCFFAARESLERLAREKNSVTSLLNKDIDKLEKKLNIYTESYDNITSAEKFRLYGELLTANLYRLETGSTEAVLENYYEEDSPSVTIILDQHRTPVENAQAYFKKYSKSKKTREALEPLIKLAQGDLLYLEGIRAAAEYGSDLRELYEIKQELTEQGYLKMPAPGRKPAKQKKERHIPKPLSFISADGFQLFVGKNNRQNDHLTIKMAREDDIWLHTKDIPGAHVIIRTEGKEVPPATLLEAASLAALFSRAGKSKNVPVDYTLKKHVHKPNGARPGMVIYERQKTIMASPDEELPDRLSPPIV
jgi:predicted ribosome quality control (RQC) complex YloA/Tae2 family protein